MQENVDVQLGGGAKSGRRWRSSLLAQVRFCALLSFPLVALAVEVIVVVQGMIALVERRYCSWLLYNIVLSVSLTRPVPVVGTLLWALSILCRLPLAQG